MVVLVVDLADLVQQVLRQIPVAEAVMVLMDAVVVAVVLASLVPAVGLAVKAVMESL